MQKQFIVATRVDLVGQFMGHSKIKTNNFLRENSDKMIVIPLDLLTIDDGFIKKEVLVVLRQNEYQADIIYATKDDIANINKMRLNSL